MKKRFLSWLLVLAMVLSMVPTLAFAAESAGPTQNASIFWSRSGLGYKAIGESDSLTELFTQLFENDSVSFSTADAITIGSGVFTEDDWASIKALTNLEELIFSDAVIVEEEAQMVSGGSTQNSVFPSTLTLFYMPQATEVGHNAFYQCSNLKTVHLPNVTTMGTYAFYDCEALESITLPKLTAIPANAFDGCVSLVGVSIPNAESIALLAFNQCSALVFADFPKVTNVVNNAFERCDKLQVTNFPSLVTLEEEFPTEYIDLKVLVTNRDDFEYANPAGTVVNLTDDAYTDQVVAIVDGEVKTGESWAAIWETYNQSGDDPLREDVDSIFIVKGNFDYNDWLAMRPPHSTSSGTDYYLQASHFAIADGVIFSDDAKTLPSGYSGCGDTGPTAYLSSEFVTFSVPQLTTLDNYSLAACFVNDAGKLKHAYLPNVETVNQYALANQDALSVLYLPSATVLGSGVVSYNSTYTCDAITIIDLPEATSVSGLNNLPALKVASLPKAGIIGAGMFQKDSALKVVNLAGATDMTASNIFSQCSYLKTVILGETAPSTTLDTDLISYMMVYLAFPVDTDYATAAAAYRADSTAYDADADTWSGLEILTPALVEATLTIGNGDPVKYPTLEEALTVANASSSGSVTITLGADVTTEATLEITNSMTLDLAGFNITADTSDSNFSVITLGDEDTTPTLTLTDTTTGVSYGYWADGKYTIVTDVDDVPDNTTYGTFTGGIISGGTGTAGKGGGVLVNDDAIFIMEGGNIAGNTADQGGGVYIDGTCAIYSGATISYNTATGDNGNGGGVYVSLAAVNSTSVPFEVHGGSIHHNTAKNGGGIYIAAGFQSLAGATIFSGSIANNTADNGGGVYVTDGVARFTMNNGSIANNNAIKCGGGIYTSGTTVLNGGAITGNTATQGGGGIYAAAGTVELSNVEISENTTGDGNGDGVYQYGASSIIVAGDTVITKNKADATSAEGTGDGIYLGSGKYISIISDPPLSEDTNIYYTAEAVPTPSAPVTVVKTTSLVTAANAAHFHEAKDHTGDVVVFESDSIQLVVWSYTNKTVEGVTQMWASSDSDDATCAGNGGTVSIALEDGTYTLVGTTKTVAYTGQAVKPTVTATNWIAEPNTVVYARSGENGWVDLPTDELPTDAGSYKATIAHGLIYSIAEYYTIAGTTLDADDFTFEAADDLTYGENAAATVTSDATDGTITLTYYDEDGAPVDGVPTDVGTYTVKITVTQDSSGNVAAITTPLGDADWTFEITAKEVDVDWSVETEYTYTGADQSDELSATYENVAGNNVKLDITVTQNDLPATFLAVGDYDLEADFATDDADSGNYVLTQSTTKTTKISKEGSQGSLGSNTDYTLDGDTIIYGDVVKIQYTPERSTSTPMRAMRAAPIALPELKTAKLYYGETLLATAENVVENIPAVLTFEVNSTNFPSADFDGTAKDFTIKWGGDDNLNGHTDTISLILAKKELTAIVDTEDDSATKVYDGDNEFEAVLLTVTDGEVFDEAIEATVDGTRASANVSALATDKAFTATDDTVTLTGTNNEYYTLPVANITGTVDITTKTILAAWTNTTQEYVGDRYLNPTVTLVGLVEGDENTAVTFTYVDGEVTDAPTVTNAGTYLVTANPGVNYTLSNPTTTFTITKAALAFTFDENGVVTAHFNGGTTTEGFQVTYIDKDGVETAEPGASGSYTVYVTLTDTDAIENFHVAGTAASEGPIGTYTVGAEESTVYFGEDDETGITAVVGATITVPNGTDDGTNKFLGWTDKDGILYKPGDLLTVPKGEMVLTPTYETIYTIGGTVEQYTDDTETTTETREGAVVALKQGNTLLEEVATQASGTFAFTSKVPAGTYNVVTTYNGITVTKIVTITNTSTTVTVTLPAGKTNSIVEVVKGTPDIVVGGLDELFKSSLYEQVDKDAVTAGGSVEFKMTLQEVTSTTSISEIEELAKNVGMYVDISISKTVDSGVPSLIPELETPVQLIIPIPAALQGMKDYSIYRQHGTDITQLTEEAVDGEYIEVFGTEIHVHAKFFSIYALGYTLPSTGSAMTTSSYQSTVASTEHGSVELSGTRNKANTTVTITPTPDTGYKVDTVTVTYSSGRTVTVTAKDNGTYTYKQPGAAVTVTVTFVETNSGLKFIDVDADDWFYNAVYWAVEKGITKGKTATLFAPSDVNTRAEAVTFLWRANDSIKMDNDTIFTDVEADSWYEEAVLWATENGTTKGTLDGTTFSPDWTCNRAMIITMIWRLAGSPTVDVENPFQDVSADAWYYHAVMWAVSQNITTGTSETTFSPDQDCSRAEIVTLLYRNAAE